MIKLYNIEKIYDSENDSLDNVDEYMEDVRKYLSDDLKNYY